MDRWTNGIGLGVRWGFPFAVSTGLYGAVFGWLCAQKGLPWHMAALMSATTFSGTAQLTTLQFWTEPLPIAAILVAAASVNARYIAMGAVLRPVLTPPSGRSNLGNYGSLALLTDAAWLLTLRASESGRDPRGVLLGSSLVIYFGWVAGTVVGHRLPLASGGTVGLAAGFLALTMFAAMLPGLWRGVRDLPAWIVASIVAAVAQPWLGTGWAVLAGGFVGALTRMLSHDE
ncbi:MAG TPA: AzlC family ABC transporter permease [Azospirillaceae bacterium]|nr:AzlC family ABC transporter permease [Azospirillaceae bacterium]